MHSKVKARVKFKSQGFLLTQTLRIMDVLCILINKHLYLDLCLQDLFYVHHTSEILKLQNNYFIPFKLFYSDNFIDRLTS